MDPGLLTKDEAEVYWLIEARLAALAGKDDTKGDEAEAAAAAAAAETQAVIIGPCHHTPGISTLLREQSIILSRW